MRRYLAITAAIVAGCAAYFSVTGLGLLFYGASISVMIMAASLELAKILTAAYLKQKWNELETVLKTYMTISVISLMLITSAGIYGFLSDAFQKQSLQLDKVSRDISLVENKIKINEKEINRYEQKISNLTNIRNSQEGNLTKLIDKEKGTSRISTMIRSADNEITRSSKLVDSLNAANTLLLSQIEEIKNQNIDLEEKVGGFRFVAEAFGVDIKVAVRWFILLIVFVFDPLAIALVLAYNSVTRKERSSSTVPMPLPTTPTTSTTTSTTTRRFLDFVKKKLMRKP